MFNLNNGGLLELIAQNANATWFYVAYIGFLLLTITAAYLLGSINSAIIVSKLVYHDDVRRHGSGNPGLTNTLRTYGKGGAGLVLLGDVLKTVIAVCIAGVLFGFGYVPSDTAFILRCAIANDGMCFVAGLFAVLGHVFPVYYNLKGGKGVLSTAALALIVSPIPFLILLVVFILIVSTSKYVSLASVSVATLYPIVMNAYIRYITGAPLPGLVSLSTIILAILIVWRHKENLKRISERTENKISFKKKPAFKAEALDAEGTDFNEADNDGE